MAKSAIITRNYQDHAITYREDGWFNATQAAKKFGKEPHEWMRLATTENYMEALGKALGGLNADSNMQLLRAECNLQKSAKHPVDFMQSRGFLL